MKLKKIQKEIENYLESQKCRNFRIQLVFQKNEKSTVCILIEALEIEIKDSYSIYDLMVDFKDIIEDGIGGRSLAGTGYKLFFKGPKSEEKKMETNRKEEINQFKIDMAEEIVGGLRKDGDHEYTNDHLEKVENSDRDILLYEVLKINKLEPTENERLEILSFYEDLVRFFESRIEY